MEKIEKWGKVEEGDGERCENGRERCRNGKRERRKESVREVWNGEEKE